MKVADGISIGTLECTWVKYLIESGCASYFSFSFTIYISPEIINCLFFSPGEHVYVGQVLSTDHWLVSFDVLPER